MRRPIPVVLLVIVPVLLSACASSSSGGVAPARPSTQTVASPDIGAFTISSNASADVVKLPYSQDAVWRILPSVFDSIGIPLTTMNPATKEIGNAGFKIRGRLGKAPLSRYLDCGQTQIGPNADSYDVFLTVNTRVTADGATGTTLSTFVDAQARPVTFNQAYSRCSSKGGIEQRISDLVKARMTR